MQGVGTFPFVRTGRRMPVSHTGMPVSYSASQSRDGTESRSMVLVSTFSGSIVKRNILQSLSSFSPTTSSVIISITAVSFSAISTSTAPLIPMVSQVKLVVVDYRNRNNIKFAAIQKTKPYDTCILDSWDPYMECMVIKYETAEVLVVPELFAGH